MTQSQSHVVFNFNEGLGLSPASLGDRRRLNLFTNQGFTLTALMLLLADEWQGARVGIVGNRAEDSDLTSAIVSKIGGTLPSEMFDVLKATKDKRLKPFGWGGRMILETKYDLAEFSQDGTGYDTYGRPMPGSFWRGEWYTDLPTIPGPEDVVVWNLDRDEFLTPSAFGDERSLSHVAMKGGRGGTATALMVLLAASCRGGARGEGDIDHTSPLVGSWAGDRIGIYDRTTPGGPGPMAENISAQIRDVLMEGGFGDYYTTPEGFVARHPIDLTA